MKDVPEIQATDCRPQNKSKQMRKVETLLLAALLTVILCIAGMEISRDIAIDNTEKAISGMKEISIDSLEVIESAEALYVALPENDREKVENYRVLQNAREEYDRLSDFLRRTEVAIDSIPFPVDLEKQDCLLEARELYDQAVKIGLEAHLVSQKKHLEQMELQYADTSVAKAAELYARKQYQEALNLCDDIVKTYDTHSEQAAAWAGECFDVLYKDLWEQKKYQDVADLCDSLILNFDVRDDAAKQAAVDCYATWIQENLKANKLEEAHNLLNQSRDKYGVFQQLEELNDTLTKKLASCRPDHGKKIKRTIRESNNDYGQVCIFASSEDVCVKLESISDPQKYVMVYVHAKEFTHVKLPDGDYVLKYTTGMRWYGDKERFGTNAKFFQMDKSVDVFSWELDLLTKTKITYTSYDFYMSSFNDGDIKVTPISPEQF